VDLAARSAQPGEMQRGPAITGNILYRTGSKRGKGCEFAGPGQSGPCIIVFIHSVAEHGAVHRPGQHAQCGPGSQASGRCACQSASTVPLAEPLREWPDSRREKAAGARQPEQGGLACVQVMPPSQVACPSRLDWGLREDSDRSL
jgi:hypothetical protein